MTRSGRSVATTNATRLGVALKQHFPRRRDEVRVVPPTAEVVDYTVTIVRTYARGRSRGHVHFTIAADVAGADPIPSEALTIAAGDVRFAFQTIIRRKLHRLTRFPAGPRRYAGAVGGR